MSKVVDVDFGRSRNEACRKMATLLGRVEARNAELREDPERLFAIAGDEIVRLRKGIRKAAEALIADMSFAPPDDPTLTSIHAISVDEDKYRRLLTCADIVRKLNKPLD